MMRVVLCVVWGLSLVGCATGGMRHWAASTLTCQERDVTLTEREQGVWDAGGCGRTAICTLPVAGGQVNCYRAGTLEHDSIQQVIAQHSSEIRYCYERALKKSPGLAGTVAVRFTIAPTGAVRSSEVAQPIGGHQVFDECVANQVSTWSFPKPSGGGVVVVTHPFRFKPSDLTVEAVAHSPSAPGEPGPGGSLDKGVIRQVIGDHLAEVRDCYERELASTPSLAGTVAVKFVILPNGAVAASHVSRSTVGNAQLEQCVATQVRTWKFPRPEGGGVLVASYPFAFRPTDGGIESDPSQTGSLDRGVIRQVIRDHVGDLRGCYERELATSPTLAGTVAVKFNVSSNGRVGSSEVARSTVDNRALEQCVAMRVRGWTFPRPNGGPVSFTYPFTFRLTSSESSYEAWTPHRPSPSPTPVIPERIMHESPRH